MPVVGFFYYCVSLNATVVIEKTEAKLLKNNNLILD
jgi:hypothetical protein